MICVECKIEYPTPNMLYDKQLNVYLCKVCFINGLTENATKNAATGFILRNNQGAYATAQKAGAILFDRMLKDQLKSKDRPSLKETPEAAKE